ncbi:uncharacterized protein LOC124708824 [Lolium rigidum]|uniref:uncharacterized protein LOC124708824 n=1 Tax=Lolium rigidum TaxID=89674 RepID=UPI001F5C4383|nr:uncharacterized protein LOC124708824 [Lolium rigidum]
MSTWKKSLRRQMQQLATRTPRKHRRSFTDIHLLHPIADAVRGRKHCRRSHERSRHQLQHHVHVLAETGDQQIDANIHARLATSPSSTRSGLYCPDCNECDCDDCLNTDQGYSEDE